MGTDSHILSYASPTRLRPLKVLWSTLAALAFLATIALLVNRMVRPVPHYNDMKTVDRPIGF